MYKYGTVPCKHTRSVSGERTIQKLSANAHADTIKPVANAAARVIFFYLHPRKMRQKGILEPADFDSDLDSADFEDSFPVEITDEVNKKFRILSTATGVCVCVCVC